MIDDQPCAWLSHEKLLLGLVYCSKLNVFRVIGPHGGREVECTTSQTEADLRAFLLLIRGKGMPREDRKSAIPHMTCRKFPLSKTSFAKVEEPPAGNHSVSHHSMPRPLGNTAMMSSSSTMKSLITVSNAALREKQYDLAAASHWSSDPLTHYWNLKSYAFPLPEGEPPVQRDFDESGSGFFWIPRAANDSDCYLHCPGGELAIATLGEGENLNCFERGADRNRILAADHMHSYWRTPAVIRHTQPMSQTNQRHYEAPLERPELSRQRSPGALGSLIIRILRQCQHLRVPALWKSGRGASRELGLMIQRRRAALAEEIANG